MAFPTITSPGNDRIQRSARLRRGPHQREQQRTLIDGVRELAAAVAANVAIDELFFCPELLSERDKALLAVLASRGATVFAVTPPVLARIAFGERDDGVVAVAVTPQRTL